REDQEPERQSRACAYGMRLLESRNVFLAPGREAFRPDPWAFHIARRVVLAHSFVHGKLHHRSNGVEPIACRSWFADLTAEHSHNVLALEKRKAFLAVLSPKPLKNIPARALCFGGERSKLDAVEICDGEGGNGARLGPFG